MYPDQPKRIFVSEKEWNELQARADAANSAQPSSFAGPLSPPSTEEAINSDEDAAWFKREILIVKDRAVGPASSTHLASQLDPSSRGSVAFDVSPLHHAKLYFRREAEFIPPALPPFDTAKRWYAAQFAYIGSIFSFIQPKYFEDRLTEVYSRSPDTSNREDCLLYCQILLILAFGKMYALNEWTSNEGPPGFDYFQAALKLLPDIHEEGSVLFVEVLGLVSYFMQILNRRDAAFLYIGLAVRMAISLGMHQEVTNSVMDDVELEHRRRIWWTTYSMDRILCVKSGNPISIHDEDIDAAWPTPLPSLDLDPAHATILSHYSKLSRILGKISEDVYRKRHKSGTTLLASVQSIMSDLETWLRAIPPELKLDFGSFQHDMSREAVSTFLHYYQCINMTGRPLLFRVCQRRLENLQAGTAATSWQDGLSSNVVHVVSNSIAAARTATAVMEAASKHNLVATYGFMDGEHAFSAALVLVMANVAFSYNERDASAMEQALSVLKAMANKGNEYIRARHALLLNLKNALGRQAKGKAIPEDSGNEFVVESPENDGPDEHVGLPTNFPQFPDIPFNMDLEDKDWEGFLGDAQMEVMSTELIQSAFQPGSTVWFAEDPQEGTSMR